MHQDIEEDGGLSFKPSSTIILQQVKQNSQRIACCSQKKY